MISPFGFGEKEVQKRPCCISIPIPAPSHSVKILFSQKPNGITDQTFHSSWTRKWESFILHFLQLRLDGDDLIIIVNSAAMIKTHRPEFWRWGSHLHPCMHVWHVRQELWPPRSSVGFQPHAWHRGQNWSKQLVSWSTFWFCVSIIQSFIRSHFFMLLGTCIAAPKKKKKSF